MFEAQLPWLHDGQVDFNKGVNRRQPNTIYRLIAHIYIGMEGPPCDTHCVTHRGAGLIGLVLFDAQGMRLGSGHIAFKRKANRRASVLCEVGYTTMQALYRLYIYMYIEGDRRDGHVTSCNTHCGNRISPRLLGSVSFDTQKACLDVGQVTWNKQCNRIEPELHNVRAFK